MRRMLLLSLVVTGTLSAQTTRVLTLEEAMAVALERSRMLGIGMARAEADRAKAAETGSAQYAGLSLVGSYSRIQEGTFKLSTTNLQSLCRWGPCRSTTTSSGWASVSRSSPRFRLSSAADAASLQADATQMDVAMIREDLLLTVASAYWTLYQARQLERFAGENVRRLESYQRDTERLVSAGVLTRNDLLRVQVQLSNGRIGELERRTTPGSDDEPEQRDGGAGARPLDLASRPRTSSGPIRPRMPLRCSRPMSWVGLALQQRPDVQAATARVRAAGAATGAARGAWWPQIDLVANYNYNNPNSRYQPITKEFLGSWMSA